MPLSQVAILMTVNSAAGLISSFAAGPVIDRLGRKWIMAVSLICNGLAYLIYSQATTMPVFLLSAILTGAINPLYRIGADAMMADLIPPEKRIDAYALLRLSNNVGVSIGPAVGGFIASASYTIAFYCAAAGMATYGILVSLFAHETLPARNELTGSSKTKEALGGYGSILKDGKFMSFVGGFTLVQMCSSLIWVLLAVYAKRNYGVAENLYGFIPMTNGIMVILFQVAVTQYAKRLQPVRAVGIGAIFYTFGCTAVILAQGFWGFWICMVIMTIGELILMPTSSTYVANLAPADKRGRYMSVYSLTWSMAAGLSPLMGSNLNDHFGPQAMWIGGGIVGAISVLIFFILAERQSTHLSNPPEEGAPKLS